MSDRDDEMRRLTDLQRRLDLHRNEESSLRQEMAEALGNSVRSWENPSSMTDLSMLLRARLSDLKES